MIVDSERVLSRHDDLSRQIQEYLDARKLDESDKETHMRLRKEEMEFRKELQDQHLKFFADNDAKSREFYKEFQDRIYEAQCVNNRLMSELIRVLSEKK